MVKLTRFTAVNPHDDAGDGGARMLEAAEAELIQLYQAAIADSLAGDDAKSERAFRALLENDLVVSGATEQLQQLRLLSMKNLAITVSKQEVRGREALCLLETAIESCPDDIGLIDRFATLAARLGEWSAAKDAFVRGLKQDPTHCTMRLKLLELLKHLDGQAPAAVGPSSNSYAGRALLRNLPAVSRSSISTNFGMEAPRKIVLDVADWISLLRHSGRLRRAHRMGCLLVEIRVAMSDNEIEIDLDLDDEGENGQDVDEGSEDSENCDGKRASDKGDENVVVGGKGDADMFGGSEPFLMSPGPLSPPALSAAPDAAAPRETTPPSQARRRRRLQTADGQDGEPWLDTTQQGTVMSMIDELGDFLDGPSSHYLREAESSQGVDDEVDAWPAVLPPDEADAILQSCNGVELPLDALYQILVAHFSQSQDLAKLKDADCRLLMELIEAVDLPLPPNNVVTVAEWVIEKFTDLKERSLGKGFSSEVSEADLRRLRALSERLLLRVAVEVSPRALGGVKEGDFENNCDMGHANAYHTKLADGDGIATVQGGEENSFVAARFLFAKGKLMQALDQVEKAKECYSACLGIISVADVRIRLDHLQDHSTITTPRVRSIMECVDFHSEMGKIRGQNQDKSGLQERLLSLSAKMLSGRETESLMLGVDPSGWKNILSALIDAAVKSNNTTTSLRCQIRLLHAMLPKGTPEEIIKAREDPVKFLDPVFKPSFTARLLNATQLDRVIYGVALEGVRLDEYEMDMLRDVTKRLLMTMHACHTFLRPAVMSNSSPDRGLFKTCRVVLTYTSAFFLALLKVGWNSNSAARANELVLVLERLFKELGGLDLLLVRRSMVPYFVLPLLFQLQSNMNDEDPNWGMLEDQVVHMLKFAFDLSLAADATISSFAASATSLKPRSITSEHELRMIWPICEDDLASYSAKMLKDRAGHFVEECYAVAAACLPRDTKAPMVAAVQKFGLQRPVKMPSPDTSCPFMPISGLALSDGSGPEGGMPGKTDVLIDVPTGQSIRGPIVDQEICDTFASIFEAKIKLSPLDLGAIDRQTDILALDALEPAIDPYMWSMALNADKADYWFATGEFSLKLSEKANELCFLEGRVPTDDEAAEILRRRNVAYWCLTIADTCANREASVLSEDEDCRRETLAGMFEFHGRALMSEGTECAGIAGPGGSGGCSRRALDEALSAFIAATRFSPSKYSNHMHIGVCSKLLGHPPRVYLPALAHACELSQQDPRGTTFVDPLFELHAARLELLENGEEGLDEETKALCSLYIFAGEGMGAKGADETATTARSKFGTSMYQDAVGAMEWCSETIRSYYKPRLCLVASPRTSALARCEHLGLLFCNKTSRKFELGMDRVQEKGPHLQKAQKAKRKRPAGVADSSCSVIPSQCQAEADVFNGVRYPVAACPAAMMPTSKNLGIGTDGTDTIRGHFLVTVRHALLEYVAALREVEQVEILEEIAVFLENADTYCLRLPEFADIIAYCRAGGMLLALQRANNAFPAVELSEMRPEAFLHGSVGVEATILCSSVDPHPGPGLERVACLEQAYDLYVDILSYTSRERAIRILHPVAKYMRWRLSRRDLSHVDEICGKMLITNRGRDLLGRYACLDVRLLANKLGEGEDDARRARHSLIHRYADFLQKVSGSNQMGMLGLVLLYHCHPLCKETEELCEKCASHALKCGQPPEKPGCDATNDPLASLRTLVQQSIRPEDNGKLEEGGGNGVSVADADDTDDTDDADDADDTDDTDDTDDADGAGMQDEDPPDDGRGVEAADTGPGMGGIAAMALAAMLDGSE